MDDTSELQIYFERMLSYYKQGKQPTEPFMIVNKQTLKDKYSYLLIPKDMEKENFKQVVNYKLYIVDCSGYTTYMCDIGYHFTGKGICAKLITDLEDCLYLSSSDISNLQYIVDAYNIIIKHINTNIK